MKRTIYDQCACCRRSTRTRWTVMLLFTMLLSSVTAWADTYKLTFHLNGGTYKWDIDSYKDGDEFNLMKAEREDAKFIGWYTTKTFDKGTRIVDVKGQTGDLEVWAKWTCDPVTYIDENGEKQTTTEYIELKGSSELAELDDSYNWYVVRGENVVYYSQIGSYGDLHLILMDGAKLTTQGTFPLQCNGNMFIFGQSQGTGQLVATSNPAYGLYAIKSITINGGTINATGGDFGISAIEGNVTINGGTVTAHGKDYFGIEGLNVIINGGSVTATSDTYHGISVNGTGTIAINGGSVTASHGSKIDIPYYGIVKIGPGKAYTTGTDGTIYCGTLTEDELKAIDSQTLQPTTWDGGTTAETATVLTKPKHLELLAQCVNAGNDFSGKFFKLGGDITFDDATLTIDNDGDGTPESNHIAIGDETHAFAGTFDGQNHTISGLRITSASPRQGLFGSLGSTGAVKNVNLSDASIAGNDYTAGIVAYNSGSVDNCHVDNTVALHCAQNYYDSFGGIVGYNAPNGIVSACTSSVKITLADGLTASTNSHFGGVVGNNNSTVTGCFAVGAIIPGVNHNGAVVGLKQMDGILTDNYYAVCTVAGTANATNVGCNSSDVEGAKIIYKLTLGEGVSTSTPATITHNDISYYAQGIQVTLTATSDNQYGYTLTYGDGSSQAVDNSGNFLMPATDVTANIAPWDGEGTEANPYIITTTTQLDQLATNVNNGNDYSGKFFKLGADITYSTEGLAETESNYTPIGMYRNQIYSSFLGTFNGDGHTVRGIRIYHEGTTSIDENNYLGLFGVLGKKDSKEGTVKNVTLADARITGLMNMGGIAGHNFGTISNCHVLDDVVIHTYKYSIAIGGVAGINQMGTISGCTSSVTITIPDGVKSDVYMLGGIVGLSGGTMRDCLAIGVTVPAADGYGAIYGDHRSNNIERNYYTGCTVAGVENATNVGGTSGQTSADRTGAAIGYTVTNASAGWMDINFGTPESTYGENGISIYATADSNVKLLEYDGVIYAPDGANLKFTTSLTNDLYDFAGVKANDTELTADESGNYSFDVASQDYVISTDGTAYWGIDKGADGSEEHPYIITTTEELDLLSTRTNAGEASERYAGKFFKLGNDITYSHTTDWNDATSTENNFTPIGEFHGSFDGDGHTISGIRIYCPGNTSNDNWKGLFSQVGNSPTLTTIVKNLFLADARITGFYFVGGIAGYVDFHSTISGCYVLSNVAIHGVQNGANCHGGIVGLTSYYSKIDHCVSAATLTKADGVSVSSYGGIVGQNQAEVCNNLVIGASIPVEGNGFGTVIGKHADAIGGTSASNNYYTACTVAGAEKTAAVGCGAKTYVENLTDLTDNDGAVPALRDGADNSTAIELLAQVPEAFKPFKVSLAGRTLYKDGNWNTLCLPFDVDNFEGTPFEDATVMTLSSSKFSNGTLTLNFSNATAIEAGMPFMVKWAGGDNVENPVFENVTIKGDSNPSTATDAVTFQGIYSPLSIAAGDNTMLYMGAGNTLHYPNGEMTIGAFRAYFRLADGITAGDLSSEQGARIMLNFDGEEATAIENLNPAHAPVGEGSWFTLDGRRINGRSAEGRLQGKKPSQRGIYINNGKRIVIK